MNAERSDDHADESQRSDHFDATAVRADRLSVLIPLDSSRAVLMNGESDDAAWPVANQHTRNPAATAAMTGPSRERRSVEIATGHRAAGDRSRPTLTRTSAPATDPANTNTHQSLGEGMSDRSCHRVTSTTTTVIAASSGTMLSVTLMATPSTRGPRRTRNG